MSDWIASLRDFAVQHQTALQWLGIVSLVMFVGTLLAIPAIVVRLPADYFAHGRRHTRGWRPQHPLLHVVYVVLKNVVGVLFVLIGIPMLPLPGQGLLTIFLGVALLDFPGKFAVERWFIQRGPVIKSINWMRRRAHREPMARPEKGGRWKENGEGRKDEG